MGERSMVEIPRRSTTLPSSLGRGVLQGQIADDADAAASAPQQLFASSWRTRRLNSAFC